MDHSVWIDSTRNPYQVLNSRYRGRMVVVNPCIEVYDQLQQPEITEGGATLLDFQLERNQYYS